MSCGRQTKNLECLRFNAPDFDRAMARGDWLITSEDVAPHAFWSGFPVVLIRRPALAQVGAKAFVPVIHAEVERGFLSEDASFFLRAHEAGLKFAVDVRVKVPHQKWRDIDPRLELLKAAVSREEGAGMASAAD